MTLLVERMFTLFSGYEEAFGKYTVKGPRNDRLKQGGIASTSAEPMTLEHMEEHLSGGKYGVGAIPLRDNDTVVFAAIDIDKYEDFDIIKLEEHIRKSNLPLVVCRSKSGGAHLYIFLEEPVKAWLVIDKMASYCAFLGMSGIEIFPKQTTRAKDNKRKDTGNWINLPYFNHKETERYALHEGQKLDLEHFLDFADKMKVPPSLFKEEATVTVEEAPIPVDEIFADGPPCLKYLFLSGGFPQGTRNDGMYNVGVYLKHRYPNNNEWQNKLMDYNVTLCDERLPLDEITTLVNSLARKEYNYTCKKSPICGHCDRKTCQKQKFGIAAGSKDKDDGGEIWVEITNVQKYMGDPIIWGIEIEGVRVITETEILLSQAKFNKLCVDVINRVPGTVGKKKWEKYLDEKIRNADIIAAPEEASSKGQLFVLLKDFCHGPLQGRNIDEVPAGKPFRDEGKVYFKSRAFIEYLESHRFRYKDAAYLWVMLRDKDAKEIVKKIKGKSERMWVIDDFEYDPTEEEKATAIEELREVF